MVKILSQSNKNLNQFISEQSAIGVSPKLFEANFAKLDQCYLEIL